MDLIKEPGKVTIVTNYVSGNNLFELLHDPDKKVGYCNAHMYAQCYYINDSGHIFL